MFATLALLALSLAPAARGMSLARDPRYKSIEVRSMDAAGHARFGGLVVGVDVGRLVDMADSPERRSIVADIAEALVDHRFLLFRGQDFDWRAHLDFASLFGDVYDESKHVNRIPFHGEKDPRVAVFSNDPEHGLVSVGIEGFHVDGNVTPLPHRANFLYCESAIEGGDTLVAPLHEIATRLERESPRLVDNVDFVSAHVADVVHPLISPHPDSGRRSMVFGLGSLSGLYRRAGAEMTREETQRVMDAVQNAIDAEGVYAHAWRAGDLLIMDNRGVAHRASDATQRDRAEAGLRVMRRVTLGSTLPPARRRRLSAMPQRCLDASPGDAGFATPHRRTCLVSLAGHLDGADVAGAAVARGTEAWDALPFRAALGADTREAHSGTFLSHAEARRMCKFAVDERAELAVLSSPRLAAAAAELVEASGVPHWVGGREDAERPGIAWALGHSGADPERAVRDEWPMDAEGKRRAYPWHAPSGQPNDCDGPGSEPCMFVGPEGAWFDFACARKTKEGTTPGPEVTWSDGVRRMYNLYPLCQVPAERLGRGEAEAHRGL
jgi:alpha-ketoglutarate-dependent taurine dioxygenase